MRALVLLVVVLLSPNALLAESFPPSHFLTQQQSSLGLGFTYPDVAHTEADVITHDVVFFYTSDMLDYYDNDVEQLVDYVNQSVNLNNEAFKRQDIPLRRNIAGIVALPSKPIYYNDKEPDSLKRLNQLQRLYNQLQPEDLNIDNKYSYKFFYDTSYVVALNRYYPDILKPIGTAFLGGKYSFISPFEKGKAERTLTHELAHNDGFAHDLDDYTERNKSVYFQKYAIGFLCDNFASIMQSDGGGRGESFFSSPLTTNNVGTPCGVEGEVDSVRAYKEAANYQIPNALATFKNNKPAKPATGAATLSLPSTNIDEGQSILIEVLWEGAELGDSVQVITRQGTADLGDFKSTLKSVYFNGNDTVSTVVVETFDDEDFEFNESLTIELIYPHGVAIVESQSVQVVTIDSDDVGSPGKVGFSVSALSTSEGKHEQITLTRSGGSDGDHSISVSAQVDTAGESDFSFTNQEIVFAHGETSKSINLSIKSDSLAEPSESLKIAISGNSQIIGSNNELVVTIAASSAPNTTSADSGSSGGSFGSGLLLILLMSVYRMCTTKCEAK